MRLNHRGTKTPRRKCQSMQERVRLPRHRLLLGYPPHSLHFFSLRLCASVVQIAFVSHFPSFTFIQHYLGEPTMNRRDRKPTFQPSFETLEERSLMTVTMASYN